MEKLGLTEISNAIRTYQAGKGETEAFSIANAFIRSMNAGMDCAVLVQNQVVNGKKVQGFAMLRDKAGHKVAVHTLTHKWSIYSSVETYMKVWYNISTMMLR